MTVAAKEDSSELQVVEAVDGKMLVQLTVDELRAVVRAEVERAVMHASEIKPPVKSQRWRDTDEVAEHFSVTPQTIRNWCRDGAPHRTFGTGKNPVYRIDLAEFDAWVEANHRVRSRNG